MIYSGFVRLRTSPDGDVDLIGDDGVTFIATFGFGEDARVLAQHVANLWNAAIIEAA